MDDLLLDMILALDVGSIANVVQGSRENEGSLYDRLSKAYYEITNQDPRADTDIIGLDDDSGGES